MAADPSDDAQARATAEAADSAPRQAMSSHKRRRSGSITGSDGRGRTASPSEGKAAAKSPNTDAPAASDPPLPAEHPPPPAQEVAPEDDGWTLDWDSNMQAYYFYNRFTGISQWENPRVPGIAAASYGSYDRYSTGAAPGTTSSSGAPGTSSPSRPRAGGYNPAIHGNYDPNADYALEARRKEEEEEAAAASAAAVAAGLPDPNQGYTSAGHFNRFTGRFQNASINPENHNDENKSRRQMSAFFDVDAAANSHNGRSLKAERRGKTLTKKELKAFKEKRREKKEEKRRAWLRD